VQGWEGQYTNVQGRDADIVALRLQIASLQGELKQAKAQHAAPVPVQIDEPTLIRTIVDLEHKAHQETISPIRSRILDLAKRILTFSAERERLLPALVAPPPGQDPSKTLEFLNQQSTRRGKVIRETEGQFNTAFSADLAVLLDQLSSMGVDARNIQWECQQTSGESILMQRCATGLAALSNRVPLGK